MDTLEGWDEQYPQAPIFKYISMVISNLNIERESELWKIIIRVPAYAVLSIKVLSSRKSQKSSQKSTQKSSFSQKSTQTQ